MPKTVHVSDADRDWLHANHHQHSYTQMADRIGCCVDTLKRILVREGLQQFDGAKYQVSRDFEVEQWERPCLSCGSTERRPKHWFFCRPCRADLGYEED